MIQIPGRKPYDPNLPKIVLDPTGKIEDKQPPKNYRSIQKYINYGDGDNDTFEERLEAYLDTLRDRGFQQLEPQEIFSVNPGALVKYITSKNQWRSGGYLVSVKDSYGPYQGPFTLANIDESNEVTNYILYKAFNNAIFSLQLEDVKEFWVKVPQGRKKRKNKGIHNVDGKSVFKIPLNETNFPVYLLNEDGENVIVYYARDNGIRNRFLSSQKFLNAEINGWMFEDGSQGEYFDALEEEVIDNVVLLDDEKTISTLD